MTVTDWIQAISMLILVVVTGIYAWRTFTISKSTEKQAKEMKEQRVTASRPVVVQKAVHEKDIYEGSTKDYFSHFEAYNAGNGPAIEVEISLLNKEKTPIHYQRETFIRAGEPPIEFFPSELTSREKSTFYLVCEYQGILSQGTRKTWYQTWLPFETVKSSKEGRIYVIAGELEFREITEKERIDAFSSGSKPK